MTWQDIRQLMIRGLGEYILYVEQYNKNNPPKYKSCIVYKAYYHRDFLDNKGKTIPQCIVLRLEDFDAKEYKRELAYIQYRNETLEFTTITLNEIDIINNKIASNEIAVKFKDNNVLSSIKNDANSKNLKVCIDMLWLLKRCKSLYETLTTECSLPTYYHNIGDITTPRGPVSIQQLHVVQKTLTSPLCYIWGVPGSGKTQKCLSLSALNLLQHRKQILVVTPTRDAADNAAVSIMRMAKEMNIDINQIKRLGARGVKTDRYLQKQITNIENKISDINEDIKKYKAYLTLSNRIFRNETYMANAKRVSDLLKEIEKQQNILNKLRNQGEQQEQYDGRPFIKVGTIDYYIGHYEEFKNIQHVFIDEAAYMSLPKACTLLLLNAPITLLGDHYQLQVVSEINKEDIDRYDDVFVCNMPALFIKGLFQLEKDELKRVYKQEDYRIERFIDVFNLSDSYRYGQNLANLLGENVYKFGISGLSKQDLKISYILVTESGESKIRTNREESDKIKNWLNIMRYKKDYSVAILTPYTNQIVQIKNKIDKYSNSIEVLTVHKSQGKEWDTVILSIVDGPNNPWYTTIKRLDGKCCMNTAISRAKKEIIIVCNKDWKYRSDELLGALINLGKEERGYNL